MRDYPATILVYKPDHIGDVILTTPVFEALRKKYPEALVVAVVGSWAAAVLQNNPYVSRVLTYDSPYMSRKTVGTEQLERNNRTLHTLAQLDVDVTINIRDDYGHFMQAYTMATGRGRIVSHTTHHSWAHLVTDPVEYNPNLHEVERHVQMLTPLGINVHHPQPRLFPSAKNDEVATRLLSDADLERSVCLFIGGGHPVNYWPTKNFAEISERLIAAGWTPVFVGSTNETELVKRLPESIRQRSVDLTSRTSLLDLSSVFRLVGKVLSNDGGPMHLAAASGAEVMAIFGSSSRNFYPYGDKHTVLDKKWACSPCPHFTYEKRIICADNLCVQSVSADEVWNAMLVKWGI